MCWGALGLLGISKPVDWDLEFEGVATDPWGAVRAGFSAEAEVSRKEWGLEWNAALEAGGVVGGAVDAQTAGQTLE